MLEEPSSVLRSQTGLLHLSFAGEEYENYDNWSDRRHHIGSSMRLRPGIWLLNYSWDQDQGPGTRDQGLRFPLEMRGSASGVHWAMVMWIGHVCFDCFQLQLQWQLQLHLQTTTTGRRQWPDKICRACVLLLFQHLTNTNSIGESHYQYQS